MDPILIAALSVLGVGVATWALRGRRRARPLPPGAGELARTTGLGPTAFDADWVELTGIYEGRPAIARFELSRRFVEIRLLFPVADTPAASRDPAVEQAVAATEILGATELALSPYAVRVTGISRAQVRLALARTLAVARALEQAGAAPWQAWATRRGLSLLRRQLPLVDPATAIDRVLARDQGEAPERYRQPDRPAALLTERAWVLRITGEHAAVPVDVVLSCSPDGPHLAVHALLPRQGEARVRRRQGAGPGLGHPLADMLVEVEGRPDPRLGAALADEEVIERVAELFGTHPAALLDPAGLHLEVSGEAATVETADLVLDLATRLRARLGPPMASG